MKPPRFEYSAPTSVDEALEILGREEDATPIAGGQSLVPLLNMRMAKPSVIVDLNGVEGLDAVEADDGRVRIGAMVRQRRLETDAELRARVPLLFDAARHIAHVAIRTRGTVGGSLAHADPAAELPAAVAALDGRLVVRGPDGERAVAATDFFLGPLMSALDHGELLVAVEVDPSPPGTGSAFLEVARTHGAFALTAAGATVRLGADGAIAAAGLGLTGVGSIPYVPEWLDEVVVGEAPDASLFERVGARVGTEIKPYDDIHGSADYRRRAASVLTARALAAAAERSRNEVA
ncbi:MAG TPA: FAD binding domain-containing protein [Solirubrobacterales bacterium]|nr:FAD binding domain-containing protein [Solirubrobacterales bacterium]